MAKKWRGERDKLTIELCLDIPAEQLPEGVDNNKARTIKISAYPEVWRYIKDDFSFNSFIQESKFPQILEEAASKACKMMSIKRDDDLGINSAFCDSQMCESIYRADREERGIYKRGKKAKAPDIYAKITHLSRWLHVLFRYYSKWSKDRPSEIVKIYVAKHGNRKDPDSMTYFCCETLYKADLAAQGLTFPKQGSFRTKYLASAGKFRPLVNDSPEQVFQRINDPKNPLHIVHEICRKLQK